MQHKDVSLSLRCHFIFDIMWSLKNEYAVQKLKSLLLVFFFFFCSIFRTAPPHPPKKKEWRGTHALSLTYKLHNFKTLSCCFSTKWKCFYLRSLRHIIVPLACFLQSETEVFLFSLCLFFPFIKEVAAKPLLSRVQVFYMLPLCPLRNASRV